MKLCPSCGRLVHAEQLNQLAATAVAAVQAGLPHEALQHWRTALELLPDGSVQAREVQQRIDALVQAANSSPMSTHPSKAASGTWTGKLGIFGMIGLAVWKFKWLAALVLTKGKLILFGLTKVSTLASMCLAIGAYAAAWGWQFAVGFVVIMYVHEMGHVYALRRLGIRADAPVFIPGLGAFVRLRQAVSNPIDDAAMGLAGPLWGLAAAVATAVLFETTRYPLFAALTHVGGILNLFNLIPIYPLDGGRGLRALSNLQRYILLAIVLAAFLLGGNGFLVIILIVAAYRTFTERASANTVSWRTLVEFTVLIAALTAFAAYYDNERLGLAQKN